MVVVGGGERVPAGDWEGRIREGMIWREREREGWKGYRRDEGTGKTGEDCENRNKDLR